MTGEGTTLEARFWAKVWRCTHRQPCTKCCWPWKEIECTLNWRCVWQQYGRFVYKAAPLHGGCAAPAYRMAYELTHGVLLFQGRTLQLCHQCHFGPCCNPWHIRPGTPSDNRRDNDRRRPQRVIVLPDGRQWPYADACVADAAFREALDYKRVWAGPVAQPVRFRERDLGAVDPRSWAAHRWPQRL